MNMAASSSVDLLRNCDVWESMLPIWFKKHLSMENINSYSCKLSTWLILMCTILLDVDLKVLKFIPWSIKLSKSSQNYCLTFNHLHIFFPLW